MKYLPFIIIFILLKSQPIFAQKKITDIAITSVCGRIDTINAFKQGNNYFLKINSAKKKKIGSNLPKDSARVAYKKALNTMLAKECGTNAYNQPDFVLLVNTFSMDISNKLFLPSKNPYPVLIDSLGLDQTHFLGLTKTTDNSLILSEFLLPSTTVELFRWDSLGKIISFNSSAFINNNLLQQHLPECLVFQSKASRANYPQFYLLYNGAVPNYELISCFSEGIGTHTRVIIPSEVGDTIIAVGKSTNLKFGGTKFNVLLVKNSAGQSSSANNNSKSAIHIKGQLIADQQIDCNASGSYYLAAYVYLRSPSDSILLSLMAPDKLRQDTILPIDFSYLEFKNWINSVMPILECTNKQTENDLSLFVVQCARTAHIFANISSNQEISLGKDSAVNQSKEIATTTAKKDTITTSLPKASSDSGKIGSKDSLAKYNILNNITLLNAFNFDFNGKLTTSYLGLFNLFAPDFYRVTLKNAKRRNYGFIAGIEKINYSNANINGNDSSQNLYLYQNALQNPLDYNFNTQRITLGATYYYEYNKYTLTSKNTSWSFYFEPTWRTNLFPFNEKDPKVGVYLLMHIELLANKISNNLSMQTLYKDSVSYGQPNAPSNMNYYLPSQYGSSSTIITKNFGTGVMLYLAPFDTTSHFYFQWTIGLSITSPNYSSFTKLKTVIDSSGRTIVNLPEISNALIDPSIYVYKQKKCFYLFRAGFSQSLSNKSELVAGMTIRGLFQSQPSQSTQYAAYIGLNLDLSILTELFSSK